MKYKVRAFTANMTIVPFPLSECPTSIKKKYAYMEQNILKLSVFHFHSSIVGIGLMERRMN